MATSDRTDFERCALAGGLLTEQQLDEARTGGRWSVGEEPENAVPLTDRQLADRLIEMGRLNPWQAKQLLEGRTKFNLGYYLIVDSIGQGGMSQVFKAEHSLLGRIVAIKVLPLSKTTPDAVANFTRESRALASLGLDHPRLVRALDAGYDGSVYYLVTEYVPGSDLRKLVRRSGPLGMHSAATIVYQVAEGLEYAHRQGLIHRDVKPGNVLVTPEGEAKLSDLGLAGPLDGNAENDPRHGKIVGTADFISPDHFRSPWDPSPAWDIYSLGCTLYYAVTGKVPFPGGSTADKARAHCELRPLDPRRLNPRLQDEFVDVVADMMAKDPTERIPSAAEVMVRLEPWVTLPPSTETHPVTVRPIPKQQASTYRRPVRMQKAPAGQLADTATDYPDAAEFEHNHTGNTEDAQSEDVSSSWSHPAAAPMARLPYTADTRPTLRQLAVLAFIPLVLLALVLLVVGLALNH